MNFTDRLTRLPTLVRDVAGRVRRAGPRRASHMRVLRSSGATLALLITGCASTESTPIQDYVWEMGHNCEHVNSAWQLDRVDAQGRYYIKGTNVTSAQDFQSCMQQQLKLHPYQEWLKANRKPR